MPRLQYQFTVKCSVTAPVEIGRRDDNFVGMRRLIPVPDGVTEGEGFEGVLLPGAVDSQVIHPDGKADISARYGVRFNDGTSIYIQNDGVRTVPDEDVAAVLGGGYVDPSHYYFVTSPKIEAYDKSREWMSKKLWISVGTRRPFDVMLEYYTVELD